MLRSHCLQRLSDAEDSGSLSMKCLCEHSKGLLLTYILGIYVQNAQLLNFRCKSIQVKLWPIRTLIWWWRMPSCLIYRGTNSKKIDHEGKINNFGFVPARNSDTKSVVNKYGAVKERVWSKIHEICHASTFRTVSTCIRSGNGNPVWTPNAKSMFKILG